MRNARSGIAKISPDDLRAFRAVRILSVAAVSLFLVSLFGLLWTGSLWWLLGKAVAATAGFGVAIAIYVRVRDRRFEGLAVDPDDFRCPGCGSPDPKLQLPNRPHCRDPFHREDVISQ